MTSVQFRAKVICIQGEIAYLQEMLGAEAKTLLREQRHQEKLIALGEVAKAAKWAEAISLQELVIENLEVRLGNEQRKLTDVQDEFAVACAEEEEE